MVVLGFDTSTAATAVGLTLASGRRLQARDDPAAGQRPGHSTRLLGLAHGLLVDPGLDWSELERIAVGVGPGTFTGLRIGIATARGLAQSSELTLVGVSSLRALAHEASAPAGSGEVEGGIGVLAVIDARRGEVFVAAYDGESEVLSPRAVSPRELGALLERARADSGVQQWVAVGDGAVLHDDTFERLGVLVPDDPSLHRIQGRAICALGEQAVETEAEIVPDYLRRPDAEIALEGAS
jgi:tRNA threonylcarbamoyladenosine biosynthesis protein TsaB